MLCVDAYCASEKLDASKAETKSRMEHDEYQYLKLIQDIIDRGKTREDRTGTIITIVYTV